MNSKCQIFCAAVLSWCICGEFQIISIIFSKEPGGKAVYEFKMSNILESSLGQNLWPIWMRLAGPCNTKRLFSAFASPTISHITTQWIWSSEYNFLSEFSWRNFSKISTIWLECLYICDPTRYIICLFRFSLQWSIKVSNYTKPLNFRLKLLKM